MSDYQPPVAKLLKAIRTKGLVNLNKKISEVSEPKKEEMIKKPYRKKIGQSRIIL